MRFPRSRPTPSEDERILPLTNVVFLLLIFFMLIGRLATPAAFSVDLPESQSKRPAQTSGLLVQIAANGRLALDGVPTTGSALQAVVARRLQANPRQPIRLQADSAVAASRVVTVMQRLRAAGAERLRLLTTSR